MLRCRAVAQLGRALEWGSRGREFKSLRPDFFSDYLSTFPRDGEGHPICYLARVIDSLLCFLSGAYCSKRALSCHFIDPLVRFLFQFFWDRSKSFISIHSPLPKPLQPLCPTPPPTLLLLFAAPLPPILIICYTNNINGLTSF